MPGLTLCIFNPETMHKPGIILICLYIIQAAMMDAASFKIAGRVVTAEDGTALPVAWIQIKGTKKLCLTDAEGYFNFDYPVNNNYYFIKYEVNADSAIYGRLFINYYSADSINFNIEISKEGKIFEKSN